MSAYFLIDPRFEPYRTRAAEARAEVLPRLAYLAVDGVDRAVRSIGGFVAAFTRNAIGRYQLWQDRQATIRTLSFLDDRMLRDIGISRAEINEAAYGRLRLTEPETATTVTTGSGVVADHGEEEVTWRKAA